MVLILASQSEIRQAMLRNAAVPFEVSPARLDEAAVRDALSAQGARPRDVADALAELKARKISDRHPGAMVLGCDQVLSHGLRQMSKPQSREEARVQLTALRGTRHELLSAAVVCLDGQAIWRHVGVARMEMRAFSDSYLDGYIARNWHSIRHSVGCYKLEEEGVRLFSRIEGDYFTVLGLPLMELLSWLTLRGDIEA